MAAQHTGSLAGTNEKKKKTKKKNKKDDGESQSRESQGVSKSLKSSLNERKSLKRLSKERGREWEKERERERERARARENEQVSSGVGCVTSPRMGVLRLSHNVHLQKLHVCCEVRFEGRYAADTVSMLWQWWVAGDAGLKEVGA